MKQNDLAEFLTLHQIKCQKLSHEPLANCSRADELGLMRPGVRLKNLFLRDNYGREHFLLITQPTKLVDTKALSRQLNKARLGFASDERLAKYLAVQPGCVSLLALVNDRTAHVQVLLDQDIWLPNQVLQCHPMRNDQTWLLAKEDLVHIMTITGHQYQVISVPALAE